MTTYTDYTLIDAIEGLRLKLNEEHQALEDAAVVQAIRTRCRLKAFREEMYETEMARIECYQVLRPFVPEMPKSPPVALQSAPRPIYDPDLESMYSDNDGNDPFDIPRVVRGMGAR